MALKFLNKKSWHTGGLKQIEAVWKAEQKDAAEKSKLEELRREKEKEREQEELKHLQEEAGLVVRQDRLDFLYEGSIALGAQHQAPSAEEYLLGKPVKPPEEENVLKELTAVPGSLFVASSANALPTANEAWARLHGDPLLQIRQQEQAALARIKQNPVKMEQIQKQASLEKLKRDAMKKEDKRKRKEEKKQQKQQAKAAADNGDYDHAVIRSEHQRHHDDSPDDHRKYDREQDRERDVSRDRDRGRDVYGDKGGDRHRHRDVYREKGGDRHRDRDDDHRNRLRHDAERGAERDRGGDRERDADRDRRHHEGDRRRGDDEAERNTHRHGHVKEERRRDGSAIEAEAARKRPRDNDADVKPSSLVKRPPHKPGRMTEEERARRLAEMAVDAEVHEKQRVERLTSARRAEQREAEAAQLAVGRDRHHASFMESAGQSVYGGGAGAASRGTVEESVRRRAHFRQRDDGDAKAFQR